MSLPYIVLSILWLALIAYAAFGGADYGAGVWDFIASGPYAQEQRSLINRALGPVWETNHVWLVFLVVGLFSSFPAAFATLCIALFVPLMLALLGVVLRGASFIFRTHGLRERSAGWALWSRAFGLSSIITPFFLGVAAATDASGQIPARPGAITVPIQSISLITPFSVTIGLMAIALCATLAAVYLTVEAVNNHEHQMAVEFRLRGLIAGAVTAVLGALGLLLSPSAAPRLWQGMLNHALPLVIATMVIGVATAATLYFGYYRIARALIVAETAFLLGTWGISQAPYIIPPGLTVEQAAGAPSTLLLLLIGVIIGLLMIVPSIYLLFYLFKLKGSMGWFTHDPVPETHVPGEKTTIPSLK